MKKASRVSAALVSAATATATVLTVGVDVPPDPAKRSASDGIDLAAAIQLLPDSGQYPNAKAYPDLTGGLGTAAYDASQQLADQLARALVNGLSLTALAQAAGVDPESLLNAAVGAVPPSLIAQIVTVLGANLPVLNVGGALGGALGSDLSVLTGALNLLGLNPNSVANINGLLAMLGLDLSDPGNLSNLFYEDILGVNIVTAGPTFTVLKMIGLDIGWVPGTPNAVADEINNSPYMEIGVNGILNTILDELEDALAGVVPTPGPLGSILGWLGLNPNQITQSVINSVRGTVNQLTANLPDLIHTRMTPAIGVGLGAFAIAMAYKQVVADLPNQPGGSRYEALTGKVNPLLGSLTILPMILINNPARPDGGMFARFAPLAALVGIDTVNPRTEFTMEGGEIAILGGLDGAKLLPILVDVGYEYQPLGDFAAWPNPVTLANNLAAALMPTYMLRGFQLDGLAEQLGPQLAKVGSDIAAGKPLSLNLYLTIDSATLPLLEPMYLTADVLDLIGLDPLAQIPMRLANALSPALTIMTDLGYANVKRNPDGTYTRDFSTAGEEVPFMSFPDVDPFLAMSDILTALVAGFVKELGPNPTQGTPNPLSTLLGGTGGLGDLLNMNTLMAEQTINALPGLDSQIVAFNSEQDGGDENKNAELRIAAEGSELDEEQPEGELDPNQQAEQQDEQQPPAAPEPGQQQPAAPELQQAEQPQLPKLNPGGRHAKVEKEGDAPVLSLGNAPRHARNIIRESLNFAPNAEPKKENTAGGNEETTQVVAPSVTATPNEQGTQENPGAEQGSGDEDKGAEAA